MRAEPVWACPQLFQEVLSWEEVPWESWTLCVRLSPACKLITCIFQSSQLSSKSGWLISWFTYSTHLWSQQIFPLVGHTALFYFKAVPFLHRVDRNAPSNRFFFVGDSIYAVEFSSLCKRNCGNVRTVLNKTGYSIKSLSLQRPKALTVDSESILS